jgi:hypothetical protein
MDNLLVKILAVLDAGAASTGRVREAKRPALEAIESR